MEDLGLKQLKAEVNIASINYNSADKYDRDLYLRALMRAEIKLNDYIKRSELNEY